MSDPDKLIEQLIEVLDAGIDQFDESVDASQKAMYQKVLELTKDLDISNGKIKPTVKNLRIIRRIKTELEDAILNDKYLKSVDKYLAAYSEVDDIQQKYFSTIDKTFKPSTLYSEVKLLSIELSVENLTRSGLSANVTSKVQDLLVKSVKNGMSYSEMQEAMRNFLLTNENGDGALARYSKQIVTDGLYGYSRAYNALATQDLGLEWYMYVGSLKKASRAFCVKMVEASKSGCMRYIHKSQVAELLKGHICSGNVPLNPKNGLPFGFKDDTTVENFISDHAGGWNCRHKMQPISTSAVPKSVREAVNK
jgi:hypothetical protein